jgi:hypothetical protein
MALPALDLRDYVAIAELVVSIVVAVVLPLVGWALRAWLVAKGDEAKRARLRAAIDIAYYVVEAIAAKTPGKIDDKLAAGLKALSEQMGRPLSDDEKSVAGAAFAALAFASKSGKPC